MPASAKDVYETAVLSLPLTEQLRLASLILEGLADRDILLVEESNAWSDQDVREVAEFSARYASGAYRQEDDVD
jgi:hypothetical protein